MRLFFRTPFFNISVRISKVSKRESCISSAPNFGILLMFSQVWSYNIALCQKLLNSITSRPWHKLSTALPLERHFRYNLGPTPRTMTNCLKNSLIPCMCFYLCIISHLNYPSIYLSIYLSIQIIHTKDIQSGVFCPINLLAFCLFLRH